MADILVVGSMNIDMTFYVDQFPQIGETKACDCLLTAPGGKGSNQAMATARLGADVKMFGCVGCDAYGQTLIDNLANNKVDTSLIKTLPDAQTGIAVITVSQGQNMILFNAGANAFISPQDIDALSSEIIRAKAIILQLEIPLPAVQRAAEIARANSRMVILNPAPYQPLSDELLQMVDYFVPNETEATALLGWNHVDETNAAAALRAIRNRGVKNPIITLGNKGVAYLDEDEVHLDPCVKVNTVDPTAAGDTFIGGLAVRLLAGDTLPQATAFAQKASALCVSRKGAQDAIPTLADLEAFAD